jgi:tetratricopeptide (TPR) repeat protein
MKSRKKAHAPQAGRVRAWRESLTFPTYEPAPPDRNPMFLEKRVYQGSSGAVYPLPVIDRIAEHPTPRTWQGIWIENDFLRVLVLPELGGRIHRILDKTNGYDLIYHQEVIKPALVGLAGPWVSGGIEFNWPQHHRPATFMPVDTEIETHEDGSVTVWCSDHDPMCRMKGMHGVCLHPDRAYVELKARACNRTPHRQTFLWWANVATRVHEAYQSFFPPDVSYVADHARRSMSTYPLATGTYYGVDYGKRGTEGGAPISEFRSQFSDVSSQRSGEKHPRSDGSDLNSALPCPAPNDLSFYANIPVPTSYMCMGSHEDFLGGYDHRAQAGIVHVANHHISPGKKQWTWGHHPFGHAWDRNLTDPDAQGIYWPYIEIMSGVYTDNQPDFSFLQPGEMKSWSQYWYPIQKIGPAQHANLDAAVALTLGKDRFRVGVAVTRRFKDATLRLERTNGSAAAEWDIQLGPGHPFILESAQARDPWKVGETILRVLDASGQEIISYRPQPRQEQPVPPPATEPGAPEDISSADELFITGLHLSQYRHATRCPTLYWREALRRDAGDARSNNAMGLWHLQRGEFAAAGTYFREAIQRLTLRNANPADGEPFYNLGLCLRHQANARPRPEVASLFDAAYAAFYKATWNQGWAGAAFHALAEMDASRQDWANARDHAHRAYQHAAFNQRAMNLWAIALSKGGEDRFAATMLHAYRRTDPLDWWTRHLLGEAMTCDTQTLLDLALDYSRAGLFAEAIALLESRAAAGPANPTDPRNLGTEPLLHYYLGWLHVKQGDEPKARAAFDRASAAPTDYCFPSRLEEIAILEEAMTTNPRDARAPYYLGNLLYDRRRHEEAIRLWERSATLDPSFSIVWRNLGIGLYNIRRQPARARAAYDRAFRALPTDARLLFERDQLWKRDGVAPRKRLSALRKHLELVRLRDDLSIELAALYNQTGQPGRALELIQSRRFQPWEGGEGGPLGQHVRSHLALGRRALGQGDATQARQHFEAALTAPDNLGEARHLLANQSDIHYWLGLALEAGGDREAARKHWLASATFQGDFQEMKVRAFSELTYYSAMSWARLGNRGKARALLRDLLGYAKELRKTQARIDYFATSLPTMLLFEDDLQFRQETTSLFLEAQARLGLGQKVKARALFAAVLQRDPSHARAADCGDGE